jgi:hypothetical protein
MTERGKDAQRRDDARKLLDIIGNIILCCFQRGRGPSDAEFEVYVDLVTDILRNAEGRAIEP